MSLLRGRRYNRTKKAVGAPEGNKNRSNQIHQNDGIETTAERLAQQHGGLREASPQNDDLKTAERLAEQCGHLA